MADCAITVDLGFGADTPVTAGSILVRRVAEGRKGSTLVLSDFRQYDFSDEALVLKLSRGEVMESIEMRPRGKTRLWQVPDVDAINYVDLEWLELVPGTDGTYVVEPLVEHYDGATGEPSIPVGDYWIAENPAHPDFGYLMQKGS